MNIIITCHLQIVVFIVLFSYIKVLLLFKVKALHNKVSQVLRKLQV